MLVGLQEMLQKAEKKNSAIASINIPNQISLRVVMQATRDTNMPVTINHTQTEEDVVPIEIAVPLMLEYARKSIVPISVRVDHGYDFDYCMKAARLGRISIMYDSSRFSLRENAERTRRFVDIIHPFGIGVEAESGAMPNSIPSEVYGQETSDLSDSSVYLTNLDETEISCREPGCDVLTVPSGTVHGMYAEESSLDIELVKKIRAKTRNVVLEMHGGPGTSFNQIQAATNAGIRKINYFTAIDTAPAPYLAKTISEATNPVNSCHLVNQAMEIIYEKATEILTVFKNGKKL